jgi:hypothetical protein
MKELNPPLIKKITLVIEAPSFTDIPARTLKAIRTLEQSIAETPALKLSFCLSETNVSTEKTATQQSASISPEHWDYWEV